MSKSPPFRSENKDGVVADRSRWPVNAWACAQLSDPDADGAVKRKRHDLVFKTVFRHFFADLVELVEPDFAARVDLTHVEVCRFSYVAFFPGQSRGRSSSSSGNRWPRG